MDLIIPKDWVESDREHFEDLLKYRNYKREGFANGERYSTENGEAFAIHTTDDHYYVAVGV